MDAQKVRDDGDFFDRMPEFSDLQTHGWLVQQPINILKAHRGDYKNDVMAVSHSWESKPHPDTTGVQWKSILEYVRSDVGSPCDGVNQAPVKGVTKGIGEVSPTKESLFIARARVSTPTVCRCDRRPGKGSRSRARITLKELAQRKRIESRREQRRVEEKKTRYECITEAHESTRTRIRNDLI